MAIASFLVHVQPGCVDAARRALAGRPGLDVEDAGDARHLVVVAEAPAEALADAERALKGAPGVLAVLTAFINVEDELAGGWASPQGDVRPPKADDGLRAAPGPSPAHGGVAPIEGGARPQRPESAAPAGAAPRAAGAA